MRVTESSRMHDLVRSVQDRSEAMSKLYNKLATQKEVAVPSDDPAKTGTIMRMTAYVESLEQNKESVQTAQSFMGAASGTLEACTDTLERVDTLIVKALNGTLSADEREAIGDEMDQLLESLVQYGNQSFDGRYIFAGTRTDTLPFSVERNADGEIETISYEGSSTPVEFSLSRSRKIAGSVTGDAAFIDSGLLESLKSMRDHLRNEEGLTESQVTDALRDDFDALSDARGTFLGEAGKLGARISELELVGKQTDLAITRAREVMSQVRDADLAQVAVDLSTQQMVYEALLAAGAKVMRLSLMDYVWA